MALSPELSRSQTVIPVVGAVIERDGLMLCAKRVPHGPHGGLWEFPGGKIEPGETPEGALAREILEELDCTVEVLHAVASSSDATATGNLIQFTAFRCRIITGEPRLVEHTELRWLPVAALHELEWAPVDIPVVAELQRAGASR